RIGSVPVDSDQRCTSPTVAVPDSMAARVVLAESQNGADSGLPTAIRALRRSGSATSATPEGTASSARATSLRVRAVAGRPAWRLTNSRSTLRKLRLLPGLPHLPGPVEGVRV